jgi:hypothetical protein
MKIAINLIPRIKAAAIHLVASAGIAALCAALVFGLWYPWPYRLVAGGQALFIIVMSVDLILGPLLTLVVFNRNKTRAHLARDLAIIVALQIGGLAYGLYTVYLARPVALVFETDRFRVVTDVDVVHEELPQALPELRTLSLTGPRVLSTRAARTSEEKMRAIELALGGIDTGIRPSFWQPYSASTKEVLQRARPLSAMLKQYPKQAQDIEREAKKSGYTIDTLKFVPLMAREGNWSALIDAQSAALVGFVPLEGFF